MTANDKVNILMVDDQPAKLLSYEVILNDLGENLIKANTAREALDLLLKMDVAVILMDVSMPDIDGFEMADMIRQHPRFNKTAIIFISAVHLSDLDRIKGYQRGAVDYISVPVVPELLRAKVSVFAELHRKTRQLESLNRELEKRVAERTEELQERADLLDLASEAIMVRDPHGTILFWNSGAEAVYGWKREEALGKNVHQLLHTDLNILTQEIQPGLARDGRWEGDLLHVTKDGREITVASRHAWNSNGSKSGILEINRDITNQLRAEEALRKTERLAAMGRVAGIIAHEINNPLEGITNAFYLISKHPSLDEEARYYAKLGEQELTRVAHITKQTLSFYRDSQQASPVSVSELLDSVLELQSRHLQLSGISLRKEYRNDVHVQGYPVELRQVFLNIIGNAVHAMPSGGCLRIHMHEATEWKRKESGVWISICDTGTGIEPEHLKHLFEPFFSTKSVKGTGLGLWISKGIIQKYDGIIRCRSLRLSAGNVTCFRIFIPSSAYAKMSKRAAAQGDALNLRGV